MPEATVFVMDDDAAVRESMHVLMDSVNLTVATYPNAEEFLADYDPTRPGCAVLDVRLPGMSGLELQGRLAACEPSLPIIMISGYSEVSSAVRAIKQGAMDFIEKPVDGQYLLDRVYEAIERDAQNRCEYSRRAGVIRRVDSLTPREREVLGMVVAGTANKNIAAALNRSQKTIEIHRANMMKKMGARSLAELVSFVHIAGLNDGKLTSIQHGPSTRMGVRPAGVISDGNGSGRGADVPGRRLLVTTGNA